MKKWAELNHALFGYIEPCSTVDDFIAKHTNQKPETVTYRKNQKTTYIEVFVHNQPLINE